MEIPAVPDSARQSALVELASITSLEFGTLSEVYRNKPSVEGAGVVRRGPYYKHQCWEDGRNRSTYIPPEQVEALRQDLEHGRRFEQITDDLATAAIQQSRVRRAAAASSLTAPEKKTSNRTASTKNTAKRKHISLKSGNVSSNKKNIKP